MAFVAVLNIHGISAGLNFSTAGRKAGVSQGIDERRRFA